MSVIYNNNNLGYNTIKRIITFHNKIYETIKKFFFNIKVKILHLQNNSQYGKLSFDQQHLLFFILWLSSSSICHQCFW